MAVLLGKRGGGRREAGLLSESSRAVRKGIEPETVDHLPGGWFIGGNGMMSSCSLPNKQVDGAGRWLSKQSVLAT